MSAENRLGEVPVTRRNQLASAKTVAVMNLAELQKKLISAAQRSPAEDGVPYNFEKRVMARLTTSPGPDEWTLWTRALWYGAGACAAVTLCLGVWSFTDARDQECASSFFQDLEQTILVSLDDADSLW